MQQTGVLFNVQRYSLHDGPGIRTILFLKGCPLRCKWCSNPESWKPEPQLVFYDDKCIGCGNCIKAAGPDRFRFTNSSPEITDPSLSLDVLTKACPANALLTKGYFTDIQMAVEEVLKDIQFFRSSGGGATLSGGEPAMQPGFCRQILNRLKEHNIHTAVETCGYAPWDKLWSAVEPADLVLFDIKEADNTRHKALTGAENSQIMENFENLCNREKEMIVRIPVIPGCNDRDEFFTQIPDVLKKSGYTSEVHLLPYHAFGSAKYKALGIKYPLEDTQPPEQAFLEKAAGIIGEKGFTVQIH